MTTDLRFLANVDGVMQNPSMNEEFEITATDDGQGKITRKAGAIATADIADSAITTAKVADVAAPTIVGTPVVPVELEVVVADGATDDVGTFVMPWKARLVNLRVFKADGNGGAGDLFEIEDSAGGIGANIATADLHAGNDIECEVTLVDAEIDLAEAATIHFRRTFSTNNACRAVLTFHKHT